jgi:hypothetical protein
MAQEPLTHPQRPAKKTSGTTTPFVDHVRLYRRGVRMASLLIILAFLLCQ